MGADGGCHVMAVELSVLARMQSNFSWTKDDTSTKANGSRFVDFGNNSRRGSEGEIGVITPHSFGNAYIHFSICWFMLHIVVVKAQ